MSSPSLDGDNDSNADSGLLSISSRLGIEIGVYAGVAVSVIMLVIIVLLLAGVVALCRKKPHHQPGNASQSKYCALHTKAECVSKT